MEVYKECAAVSSLHKHSEKQSASTSRIRINAAPIFQIGCGSKHPPNNFQGHSLSPQR